MVFAYGTGTLCGWLFNTILLTIRLITSIAGPTTPTRQAGPVWAFPRSLATTSGMISFPLGTKMFQFPRFPSPGLCVQPGDDARDLRPGDGFPHSDIPGSQPAHGSPRLIAVFRVLHRHLAPRHPPHALSSLTHVMRRNRRSSSRYSVVKVRRAAHVRPRPPAGMVAGRLQAARPSRVRPPGSVAQLPRPRSRKIQPHRQFSPARFAGLLSQDLRVSLVLFSSGCHHSHQSPSCSSCSGGDEGTRTPDFCFAKAALSQLSYIPEDKPSAFSAQHQPLASIVFPDGCRLSADGSHPVGLSGFEPETFPLSEERSNQLS